MLCAYGHDHTQACDKKDPTTGLCIDILTGADSATGNDGCFDKICLYKVISHIKCQAINDSLVI